MLINSHYNNRLIICIDLFLRQPAWGFFLFKPDRTGRPWNKTASCSFWCSKGLCTQFLYVVARLQFTLSEMIAANYPHLCHLQIRLLQYRWSKNLRALRNFGSLFVLLQRNTLYEGHYLEVCLLFPGPDAVWQLSLREKKVLWDVRALTCGELGFEQCMAETSCFPESCFWISQVWSWSVQSGYLCQTAGSTASEFPFSPTHCLLPIADGSVSGNKHTWLMKKGCKPI